MHEQGVPADPDLVPEIEPELEIEVVEVSRAGLEPAGAVAQQVHRVGGGKLEAVTGRSV